MSSGPGACFPAPQILRPLLHQPAPALEQVRTPIGCLNLVLHDMRQRSLDDLARMVRLLGHPVSKARPEAVRHGHDLEFPEQPA